MNKIHHKSVFCCLFSKGEQKGTKSHKTEHIFKKRVQNGTYFLKKEYINKSLNCSYQYSYDIIYPLFKMLYFSVDILIFILEDTKTLVFSYSSMKIFENPKYLPPPLKKGTKKKE